MTNFGLLLIVLGWGYQAWSLFRGNKTIRPVFVGMYALGVLFLMLGVSPIGVSSFLSLDGLSFIIALIILVLLLRKGKTTV
jgi:glucose uptake protein GlcU